jgi:hypothetical protein
LLSANGFKLSVQSGEPFSKVGFVFGIIFFVIGLIFCMRAFRDSSLNRNSLQVDDQLVDAVCEIIEPDVDPADVTSEVPIVEVVAGGDQVVDKESNPALAKAQEIAKNRWKVVQVALVLDINNNWRAMVTLRSTVDNSCEALDINSDHHHALGFFCLEQGQEVRLYCDGKHLNPVYKHSPISADYLRVVEQGSSKRFTLEDESEDYIGLGD